MSRNWSEKEVEATVEDYFGMLRLELTGQNYNKSEHRRELIRGLDDRSSGAIELKHQNISAVLIEMGIPPIDGYKPRFNYQRTILPRAIIAYLSRHPDIQEIFRNDVEEVPTPPAVEDFLAALESPPQPEKKEIQRFAEDAGIFNPLGGNYLEMEAQNKLLGNAGEQFAINFERARLIHGGKEGLADRIEQVSVTVGPSAGYDIRSFELNGTDRFIETKTTKYGKNTPFFVSPNELRFSDDYRGQYFLYRVFKFRDEPRVFTVHGFLQDRFSLKPSQFLAKPA